MCIFMSNILHKNKKCNWLKTQGDIEYIQYLEHTVPISKCIYIYIRSYKFNHV